MKSLEPKDISVVELQRLMQTSIGPRPIALASTVDADGRPNLSPFSFFNMVSTNPPILVFSPSRRVRDNTNKHTLFNVQGNLQVVINVVTYDMVQQTSLSSTEYQDGVNEFIKSGLTMVPSDIVKPFRVKESPVQYECVVQEVIGLGNEGGAGNLVICEVVKIHVNEDVLDENGQIDQHKIDLVARMGANWYTRANEGIFEVEKPLTTLGLGVDALPTGVVESGVFSGNDLGVLGNIEQLPSKDEVLSFVNSNVELKEILTSKNQINKFKLAKKYLEENNVPLAWKTILAE
ncbi:flavin reductase family protein [Myroides marinus]|uniref:NADH-FMN oxidoreductase RutF, flavin reductase (DIM6/NTAB) family n=1 Tax=Myroides marinus TaxID=703342 RepID=A0A1H6RIF1_9FLAO|nr:flavin reductase family protein [Myroides marinus]MDM1345517.1 flavin reductase family protein [Myroides marinus]MDM1349106.1 flavin reductase family protein [Myroides marinus]MDM1352752.1 flavin reductase family protein [Myroides marinus]MDM1356316.1 flavin reductase family protein [Myroides marinus]MDM1360020.1 flavin reductase family protein [Myroides marinus]